MGPEPPIAEPLLSATVSTSSTPAPAVCYSEAVSTLTRFVLWDFKRGSWQYDVMCALILGFVFLTPQYLFHDQPRPANVQMLSGEPGTISFWIAPELLAGVPAEGRKAKASALVSSRFKTHPTITRVEQILDEENDVKGYMAYARQ